MPLDVGTREQSEEKVLLVCRSRSNGGIRIDWWPSVKEAERHDMQVLEIREKVALRKKVPATGGWAVLERLLGRSGSQDRLLHRRGLDQKEFFNR